MEKKAFYTFKEAKDYADNLAKDVNGYVSDKYAELDCDSVDSPVEIEQWSGTISALEVIDADYNTVAKIGFWE